MEHFRMARLPILDYCSQLWSPSKVGDIQQIEQIQKSFTRKIRFASRKDYWERLEQCHLFSLQRRRERYRIIYVWKILEGIVPNLSGRGQVTEKQSLRFIVGIYNDDDFILQRSNMNDRD